MHSLETSPDIGHRNVVKKVKKAVNTTWLSLHALDNGVCAKYVALLETFSIIEIWIYGKRFF